MRKRTPMNALELNHSRARRSARYGALLIAASFLGAGLTGCGPKGEYVWVDTLPAAHYFAASDFGIFVRCSLLESSLPAEWSAQW